MVRGFSFFFEIQKLFDFGKDVVNLIFLLLVSDSVLPAPFQGQILFYFPEFFLHVSEKSEHPSKQTK